jgi:uncharacterized protein with ATP-grasp and redox domains
MSVFIGSTTQSQRNCLSKEFKKLYAKKTFIPRKQKIAIALNTCDVGIKGVKQDDLISKRNKLYIQAMKLFPNSPNQIKVRKEIERLNKLITK